MNPQHDDFADLRRLLAFKRHEQPPPGFFEGFSREVSARIRSGERVGDSFFVRAFSWLQSLWSAVETRPLFAGGFGLAVCGLLLVGVFVSEKADPAFASVPGVPVNQEMARAPVVPGVAPVEAGVSLEPVTFGQRRDLLFQRVNDSLRAQPALFSVPAGQ